VLCVSLVVSIASIANAVNTNGIPEIQAVYGGSIRQIDIIVRGDAIDTSRLFVSTDFSANSIFYADVNHSLDPAVMFLTNNFRWRVVPDFDAQANYGTVSSIAAHEDSGRLFAACDRGILSCTTTAGSLVTNISSSGTPGGNFLAVSIYESTLIALASVANAIKLYFGTLDPSGNFTPGPGSPVSVGLSGIANSSDIGLVVNPSNQCVYVIDSAGSNGIRKSSDPCASLSGATTFSTISLPAEASGWQGNKRLGFGPEGRMFVGGSASNYKMIAYSDNDGGSWTNFSTGAGGTVGNNIRTSYDTNLYGVLYGGAVSTNKGEAGSWKSIGYEAGPFETHANDSDAFYDPILDGGGYFYCSSDQGIACSTNGGRTIFEIDYGLEAVAIQDLDMTADKTLAWTASKSGLRRGAGTPMALQWTPDGTFPTGDGSPYYSIAIDKNDLSGNTIYAGNGQIYKSTDGGTNWTRIWACESNTNGFPLNGHFATLTANGQTIIAGFYSGSGSGGLLVSADGGTNWMQGLSGVDVNDVLLASTNSVLIAADYNASSGKGGIYNQSFSGRVRELTDNISIRSFALDSAGGVYACGQFPDTYAIKIYYKLLSESSWTEVTTNGLMGVNQMIMGKGPVITVGRDSVSNDLPIIVIDHSLYYLLSGATTWQTSDELRYPNGSEINVLYWDELMVGTSEGLYGQNIVVGAESNLLSYVALAADFDGDAKADPALYNTNGTWKIKLSSGGYSLLTLAGFLGGSGYGALAGDFDGDAKADPAVYYAALELWAVKLSSLNYLAPTVLTSFGGADWQAVAADFDGDRLADPALYNTNGTWKIKLSTANYTTIISSGLLGFAGWTGIAADLDGDGKADPAIYKASTGSWIVLMSSAKYAIAVLEPGFLGSTGYVGLAADFDADAYADPTVAETSTAHWKVKLSSGNYTLVDLPNFLGE
jgi:hypothetical protein